VMLNKLIKSESIEHKSLVRSKHNWFSSHHNESSRRSSAKVSTNHMVRTIESSLEFECVTNRLALLTSIFILSS